MPPQAASRRHWIPPAALAAGQLAHGASWLFLLVLALRGQTAFGLPALAWLHLVALGWITLTALAVLVHVVPAFTDAAWRNESIARAALWPFALGVVALVVAFATGTVAALPYAGLLIALAFAAYLVPALRTLRAAYGNAPREAAIARALSITLGSLAITVLLGVALASMLAGYAPVSWLTFAPPVHGSFGLIGWLTVLAMGVSTRTVRPITGNASRFPRAHVAVGSLEVAGVLVFSAGTALHLAPIAWLGACALFAGALIYVVDLLDIVRRATVTHRPPQAFLAAAALWLTAGMSFALATLAGATLGAVAVFILLVGWLGQIVNAHIHHIGVRLLATVARGDDDETPPAELLTTPLSWAAVALFQIAVGAGAFGIALGRPHTIALGAAAGCAGWATMAVNIIVAGRRANRPPSLRRGPVTISLLHDRRT